MIESGTIESVVSTLFKGGPAGLAALAVLLVFLALVIRVRTNSTHTIFRLLWRLISGKAKSVDTAFNDFMDAQDILHQFRFISGQARTVAQMHSLIRWCTLHNEDIVDVNACGPYFDRELPGLKPPAQRPGDKKIAWTILALLGLSSLLFASAGFAAVRGAVIILKKSEKWVVIETRATWSLRNPGKEYLTREQCRSPLKTEIADSGFTAQDAAVICDFYADPGFRKFIDKTVFEQQWFFGPIAALLLAYCLLINKRIMQGRASLAMSSRLDRPRP